MDVNYTSTNKKIIRSIKNGTESYDIKDKMTGKNNLSRAIRVYRGGAEVRLHPILSSVLKVGTRSTSQACRLSSTERAPVHAE